MKKKNKRSKETVIDYDKELSDKLENVFKNIVDILKKIASDIAKDNCYFFWLICFSFILFDYIIMSNLKSTIECLKNMLITHKLAVDNNISLIPSEAAYAIMQMSGVIIFAIGTNAEKIDKQNHKNILKIMLAVLIISLCFLPVLIYTFDGGLLYLKVVLNNIIIFIFIIITMSIAMKSEIYYDRFTPAIILFVIHVFSGSFNLSSEIEKLSLIIFVIISCLFIFYQAKISIKILKWNTGWFLKMIDKKQYVCLFSLFIILANPFIYTFFMSSFLSRNLLRITENVKETDNYQIIKSCFDIAINTVIIIITYKIVNGTINNIPVFNYIFIELKNVL